MQQKEEIKYLEISEDELQAIYIYLAMNYEEMTMDEKLYWTYILEKIDPEYGTEN